MPIRHASDASQATTAMPPEMSLPTTAPSVNIPAVAATSHIVRPKSEAVSDRSALQVPVVPERLHRGPPPVARRRLSR